MRTPPAIALSVGLLAAFLIPSRASAQDDPPTRIARLGYISGAVSFEPAGTEDWIDAMVNRPLTTGDRLWTDQGSRVSLHMGSASVNLSENTDFSFLNLTDGAVQIQLNAGTIRMRVKRLDENETFEVDTPNLAFTVMSPGIYRINVSPDGGTTVIEDRRGNGEISGGGAAYSIQSGDVGTFTGTGQLNADVQSLGNGGDGFEQWCEQRDHHEDVSTSARYMSDDAIGYDDLDDAGGWRPVAGYGMVWFPHLTQPGWAPYHQGHWAYIPPWGYTWVDDAPWGFAPFHYGRWVSEGGAWGWIPCPPRPVAYGGPVYVRPVYAPALVAWIGGPHFGIGITVGNVGVGWFPLGPREVYAPSYPVSRNYFNNVNVSNTTVNKTVINNYYTTVVVNKTVNVTNVTYVNQRVAGAVAVTSRQSFTSGQPVARNMVRVDAREVSAAPVNPLTPAAVPERAAVLGGHSQPARVRPPAAVQARSVVAKATPPPPPPAFEKRQAAIQSNGGRPLSIAQVRQIAPPRAQVATAPQIRMAPPAAKPVPARAEAPKPVAARTAPAQLNTQRPPTAYPANDRLEQQHQQQSLALHQKQDQERQQVEQQQVKENQVLQQQKAEELKRQQMEQQHQQQLQAVEQRHQQEQQQLQRQQEEQHQRAEQRQPAPKPQEKPKPGEPPKKPAEPSKPGEPPKKDEKKPQ